MGAAGSNLTQKVGRYEVVGHLAAGGMAEILLGRLVGPSGFERPVVIKRILPHLARMNTFVEMFVDEARIIAGIRHPNVVQVQELGREGGELFLVMEYLEGESAISVLRRVIARNQRLHFGLCAFVAAQVCAGLHAAHELTDLDGNKQNLVHRDVSPQNIFITYSGQVKVIDFGIAKAADRITQTEAGKLKGKFEYMSPEQCNGDPVDRRSDLFALGAVLYELSTARQLFKRQNKLHTLRAITEKPIPPPSRFVPDYPKDLEAVCLKALARRVEDRYQTAAELRRELMRIAHRLGEEQVLEEELQHLMQDLFRDRMHEKAEMLRRVRLGSELTYVPEADTDSPVEVPIVPDDSEVGSLAAGVDGTGHRLRPTSSKVGLVVAIIIAFLGATAFAIVLWRFSRPPLPAAVPPPSASVLVVPQVRPSLSVTITIKTVPDGAEVRVDGEVRGTTPVKLELLRSDEPLPFEVRLDGYAPIVDQIKPDVDQRLRLPLVSLASPEPSKPPRVGGGTKPSAKPAASKPSFYRFD